MIGKNRPFVLPFFAVALTAHAFVKGPGFFAATYAGWWVNGVLLAGVIGAAALFAGAVEAAVAAAFTLPVLLSAYGLPNAVGLPFLFAAIILARRAPVPESRVAMRVVALGFIGWIGYAFWLWFDNDVAKIQSTWGYVKFFSPGWPEGWSRPPVSAPFGNANPMSGFAVMLLPLFVALTVAERKEKLWRTPWAVGAALAAALLLCGTSRPAQIAPFAAAALYLMMIPGVRLSLKRKLALGAGVAVAAAVFIVSNPSMRALLSGRAERAYSDEIRRDFLEGGINLFLAHPLAGVGPGGVPIHYSAHMGPFSDQPGCHQLHSTPLQWLAEYGVAGGLLWAALAAATVYGVRRAARAEADRALRAGAAIAATAHLVYSLLDYQLYLPVTAFSWGACIGFALRGAGVARPVSKLSLPPRVIFAAAAPLALAVVFSQNTARSEARVATKKLVAGDAAGALDALGCAMDAAPGSPVYPAVAASLVSRLPVPDAAGAAKNRAMADALYAKARANAPDFPYLAAMQGWLWVDADPARAVGIFKKALALAPKLPHAWKGLAHAYGRMGKLDAAVSALALRGMVVPEDLFSPEIRSGFYSGAAPRVRTRFHELCERYAREFPADRTGAGRLAEVTRQADAWAKSGEKVTEFIRLNPTWSASPQWKHLAATLDATPDKDGVTPLASRCLMTAAAHLVAGFEIKDGSASMLVEQCAGRGPLFEGVRTLTSDDGFGALGLYFGDTAAPAIPGPYKAETDMLALLFVYESNPVRPHLAAKFFTDRLAELP